MKQLEHEKEQESAYWQEIFGTLTEGICVFDFEGGLYDMNDAFANLVGYSKAELLQKGWLDLIAPEYQEEAQKHFADAMAGRLVRFEQAYVHRDGHHVPILISYRLLKKQPQWDKDRLVATCTDLTEAKARQQALEEEKSKREELQSFWKILFDRAPVGKAIFDVDGHYREVNPKFCEMTGLSRDELLSPAFDWKTIFRERLDETMAQVKKAMDTGQSQTTELVITTKGGRVDVLTTIASLPLRDEQGRPLQAAWFQDISLLKQQEEEVRRLLDDAQAYLRHLAQAELIYDRTPKEGAAKAIQDSYNETVASLQVLIEAASHASVVIGLSAEKLRQSQADLAARSSREAASLEEISATVEELSTAVAQTAKNASESSGLAEDVHAHTASAQRSAEAVTDIIVKATKNAEETRDIAQLVQQIAFQTNILSLNAAVEAARAQGDGRSFAVIATEIRRLSTHVTQEAKRVEHIVDLLMRGMHDGEQGILQVTQEIQGIASLSATMAEYAKAIAHASKEQDSGLVELAKGVATLEEALSQNAAMAEGIQETSEAVASQVDTLMTEMAHFHLDGMTQDQASKPLPSLPSHAESTRTNQAAFSKAVLDAVHAHLQWRHIFVEALQTGQIDPQKAGDASRCAFGRWLMEDQAVQAHPEYNRIMALHQAFHQEAQRIANLIQQGKKAQAAAAFDSSSRFRELSSQLAAALEGLLEPAAVRLPPPAAPAAQAWSGF